MLGLFHSDNTGSNPVGDASKITAWSDPSRFFLVENVSQFSFSRDDTVMLFDI